VAAGEAAAVTWNVLVGAALIGVLALAARLAARERKRAGAVLASLPDEDPETGDREGGVGLMRPGVLGLLRRFAARWRDVCGPPADGVARVDDLDDALKHCRAILHVCGARLRQKLSNGLAMFLRFGLKAEHLVRMLGEFFQQLVFRLFSSHVAIVVPPVPMFKLATRAAMRHTLPDHDLNHETHRAVLRVLQHDLHDALHHD
jgi:hypothetical protein